MFADQIAIGHSGDEIANRTMQPVRLDSASRSAPEEGRFLQIRFKDGAKEITGSSVQSRDAWMIIEIRVEKAAKLSIRR